MATSNSYAAAVRQRRDHWREIMRRWGESGLSQAVFCRRHKLRDGQFSWWKRWLAGMAARGEGQSGAAAPTFVPVNIVQAAVVDENQLELLLKGERSLRFCAGIDPARLSAIVKALEAPPC